MNQGNRGCRWLSEFKHLLRVDNRSFWHAIALLALAILSLLGCSTLWFVESRNGTSLTNSVLRSGLQAWRYAKRDFQVWARIACKEAAYSLHPLHHHFLAIFMLHLPRLHLSRPWRNGRGGHPARVHGYVPCNGSNRLRLLTNPETANWHGTRYL